MGVVVNKTIHATALDGRNGHKVKPFETHKETSVHIFSEGTLAVFEDRYAWRDEKNTLLETSPIQMVHRVADGLARTEHERQLLLSAMMPIRVTPGGAEDPYGYFSNNAIRTMRLVPGGRVLAGVGLGQRATLANCFVVPIEDSRAAIYRNRTEAMETLSKGGGVGINWSPLRPKGEPLVSSRGTASGPTTFATAYNADALTISQGGSRRAANMFIIGADHPEVMEFLGYKPTHKNGTWECANVSLGVVDGFVEAVKEDKEWELKWKGEVRKKLNAREMFRQLAQWAWEYGDPGLFNMSQANRMSNTYYFEELICTNPCGEVPLPAYGVCFLANTNLAAHVRNGKFDWELYEHTVRAGIRLLDACVDASHYPVEDFRRVEGMSRSIGLSFIGLADALILMGVKYGSQEALEIVARISEFRRDVAYDESVELAKENGPFPMFDADKYLASYFGQTLPEIIRAKIRRHGIRNAVMLTQNPNGGTSNFTEVSASCEPNFDRVWYRPSRVGPKAYRHPLADSPFFVTAHEVHWKQHADMQLTIQKYTDRAVSKTINLPNHAKVEDVEEAFIYLLEHGAKGVTVFRDGCRDGAIVFGHDMCPNCELPLERQNGCWGCPKCDYSKCDV